MEEIKAYIESGILELYVMGELSPDEMREVEMMAAKHPAIQSELSEIENGLERYAGINAISPAESLRDKILSQLPVDDSNIAQDVHNDEPKIVALTAAKSPSFFKYAFAAAIAVLLLSWVALYSVYSSLQNTKNEVIALQASNERFSNRANYINKELNESRESLDILRNPNYKRVQLNGTKLTPDASMIVAFNPEKKEVLIDLSSLKLAPNDDTHQYQLWALVDGKPVDLGVFDSSAADSIGMKRMKTIGQAQAFAVTLEPKGGSVSPTMDQMVVMGGL